MEEMWPLLLPKNKFEWTPDIDETFKKSKTLIIKEIKCGVEIYDPSRPTCLRPDWSKQGIGYFLLQKHCSCPELGGALPNCCDSGWRIFLVGSRFLSSAEANYVAIKGEALAVACGLEQTKYFTMGCLQLSVVTEHKPLVKVLDTKPLDDVMNPRLFRLKQHVAMWKFDIAHLPGRCNWAADAASRKPMGPADEEEAVEASIAAFSCAAIAIS